MDAEPSHRQHHRDQDAARTHRCASQQRVHPGHDWFFVLEGRVLLTLGDREITVETGEAAEFGTMTPHATRALGGPAELIMIFDRDGQRAHLHSDTSG